MATVSLCMIVKNEEHILEKALTSIAPIADEILITDTGSTDCTVDIAKQFANTVDYFEWVDDFAAAYNYATQKATGDYILRWDADWILADGGLDKLREWKNRDFDDVDMLQLKWILEFEGSRVIRYQPNGFIFKRLAYHWVSPIHAHLVPTKKARIPPKIATDMSIAVFHDKNPTIKAYRYEQTARLIQSTLAKQSLPDYEIHRLRVMYVQGLLYAKKYQEALDTIQSIESSPYGSDEESQVYVTSLKLHALLSLSRIDECLNVLDGLASNIRQHPRITLLYADTIAAHVHTDINKAVEAYQAYLLNPLDSENIIWDYSPERFDIHPRYMLAMLYFKSKKYIQAHDYAQYVASKSARAVTRRHARTIVWVAGFMRLFHQPKKPLHNHS